MSGGTWYLPSPDGEGTIVRGAHGEGECAGRGCALHGPSDHGMRDWPMAWEYRPGRGGAMLRRCPHGRLLGDPDDQEFRRGRGMPETPGWCDDCSLGVPPF